MSLKFLEHFPLLNFFPLEYLHLCLTAQTHPFACLAVSAILRVHTSHYSESQHSGKANQGFQVPHFSNVFREPVESSLLPVFVAKVLLAHEPPPLTMSCLGSFPATTVEGSAYDCSFGLAKPQLLNLWPFTEFADPCFGITSNH